MTRNQSAPRRFASRPVDFEADRIPNSNDFATADEWWVAMNEIADWCGGTPVASGTDPNGILVAGAGLAGEGDWILRLRNGEFAAVPNYRFVDLYEPAPDQA